MIRLGLSPRACWARWVEGWKKDSRSQRASWSFVSMSLVSLEKGDAQCMHIACTFACYGNVDVGNSRQPQSRQTYLTSMKASMPRRAPSRPRPDCLKPPKGIGAPVTLVRLTATMPNCSARLTR